MAVPTGKKKVQPLEKMKVGWRAASKAAMWADGKVAKMVDLSAASKAAMWAYGKAGLKAYGKVDAKAVQTAANSVDQKAMLDDWWV